MGEAAGRGSDFVVLTSDNPRNESPITIINDAVVGVQRSGVKYTIEADRRAAIQTALAAARPKDFVLLAGKGHEKVQIVGAASIPFDDRQVATEILRELGYDCGGVVKSA
jgi:UDP-N-acetylmuramoyl-L-alanyl-D-glutamate--2,6-diaminopimelate ligase